MIKFIHIVLISFMLMGFCAFSYIIWNAFEWFIIPIIVVIVCAIAIEHHIYKDG